MKTKSLFFALLCLMATFISCNKSDDKERTPSIPKIRTITRTTTYATTINTYEYDVLGRLIKITGSDRTSIHYEYRNDTIIKIDLYQQQTDTLILNKEGLVVSVLNKWITNEYNPDGKLVKTIFASPSGQIGITYEYKISDGNTTTYEFWAFQKLSYSYDYEYLPNSTNTIGNENMGGNSYGKQDKNLVSVCYSTTLASSIRQQINYRYEMDAQNRVVKRWTDSPSGNIYEEFTYY